MATITLKKRPPLIPAEKKKRKSSLRLFVFNPGVMISAFVMLIATLCFLYLSEFNIIASQGVIINDLEHQRSELIIENEVWNMRIAQLKSMDVIEQQEVVKRMVTIDPAEIEFIDLDRRTDEES